MTNETVTERDTFFFCSRMFCVVIGRHLTGLPSPRPHGRILSSKSAKKTNYRWRISSHPSRQWISGRFTQKHGFIWENPFWKIHQKCGKKICVVMAALMPFVNLADFNSLLMLMSVLPPTTSHTIYMISMEWVWVCDLCCQQIHTKAVFTFPEWLLSFPFRINSSIAHPFFVFNAPACRI